LLCLSISFQIELIKPMKEAAPSSFSARWIDFVLNSGVRLNIVKAFKEAW
jgi:hypothetical protein